MANLQLAKNLKMYREANGYTQDYVSMKLNISRQAYSNYERGTRNPDIDLIVELTKLYQVSLEQLVLLPFSYKNRLVLEQTPYLISGQGEDSEDILFLSQQELLLILEYREADTAQQDVIKTILNVK